MRTLNRWDWSVYDEMFTGEPDAGKLHVRFDEGFRRERHHLWQPPVGPTLPVLPSFWVFRSFVVNLHILLPEQSLIELSPNWRVCQLVIGEGSR